jgi:regulator of protease activity HflC (stomatin/prohibitin superfamily)
MDAGVIENCGKFSRVVPAGCVCLQFPCETIVRGVSLRVQYLDVACDTKTKDNVFVKVVVAVQYKVIEDKVPSAFYKLTDPKAQIRSYVFDVVRSSVPRLDLDSAFASKDDIANSVRDQLAHQMLEYGYEIIAALVIDLDPNTHVKAAMNEINASQRLREAAAERAEAEKILQVKAAEAEAESKYLSGLGVAKQRKAIVDGLRDTVNGFSHDVDGAGPRDVLDLLLISQYFDMLKDLGHRKTGSTLFLPHGPHAIQDLRAQLKSSFSSLPSSGVVR